jgi:cytochrome c peroxidase
VGIGLKGKDPKDVDVGRQKVTNNPSEFAAFKTPSLRNITRSAPYDHEGSVEKLEDMVRFMASGGYKNPTLDPKMVDKKLTDDEIK